MHAFQKAGAAILIAGMLAPVAAFAQTASSTASSSAQTHIDQLKALQQQMQSLQTQRDAIMAQLVATMKQGSRGEQVKILQQMLMLDPTLFPGGSVTGFYGKQTAEAVKRFQKKHGIEQAGNVGPKTLKKLNEIFAKMGTSTATRSDDDSRRGSNDDRDDRRGRDDNRGPGSNSGSGNNEQKVTVCHKGETLTIGLSAYYAHINHGDKNGPCNAQATTTPVSDMIAPGISGTTVTAASTTALIGWTTTENATGKVYYGTANPLVLSSALSVATTTLSTTRTLSITGLSASTTYYFVLEAKDAANNVATSSQGLFTTSN